RVAPRRLSPPLRRNLLRSCCYVLLASAVMDGDVPGRAEVTGDEDESTERSFTAASRHSITVTRQITGASMKKFLMWALSVASFVLGYLGIPLPGCAASPENTRIAPSLLLAIKDAKDQARSFGSRIWPGYETAPFGLLATLEGR